MSGEWVSVYTRGVTDSPSELVTDLPSKLILWQLVAVAPVMEHLISTVPRIHSLLVSKDDFNWQTWYWSWSGVHALKGHTLKSIRCYKMVSAHLSLALHWIGLLNTLDYAGMASVMSANFVSIERPVTLGFPPVGKQAYIDRLKGEPISYFNVSLAFSGHNTSSNLFCRFRCLQLLILSKTRKRSCSTWASPF